MKRALSQEEWRVLLHDLSVFYLATSLILVAGAFALGFLIGKAI